MKTIESGFEFEPSFLLAQLGMQFLQEFPQGSSSVYRARNNEGKEILVKVPLAKVNSMNGVHDYCQFRRNLEQQKTEIEALDATSDLMGITRKLGVYDVRLPEGDLIFQSPHLFNGRVPVLVKQYIPGETLGGGARIVGKGNQEFMERTLNELYEKGICLVDNVATSIVVTPNGRPIVTDMGFTSRGENKFARDYNLKRSLNIVRDYYVDN